MVDASVVAEHLLPGRDHELVAPLFEPHLDVAYWLPDHGVLEVTNVLRKRYVTDARYSLDDLRTSVGDLLALGPVTVSTATLAAHTVDHADAMTPYDAAYVVLALARPLPLCTLDAGMADAARRAGVTVLEPGTAVFDRWLEAAR